MFGIFFTDATYASGGLIIFVKQGLSFSELINSSLSSLDPYFDYVEVNISPNDASSISFLNVYAPLIRCSPRDSRTDSFSPLFFLFSEISSFWGIVTTITPTGTQKVFLTPWEAIAPLAVTPLLASPLFTPLLLLGDASEPGF